MNSRKRSKKLVLMLAFAASASFTGLTQETSGNNAQDSNARPARLPAERATDQDLPLEIDLDDAKNLAVANSDPLKDAAFQLQASTQLFRLGIRERLPRIAVGYSGNDTVIVGAQDSRLKSAGITITQPLFKGGLATRQKRLMNLQLQLGRQDYEKQKNAVLDEIALLFHRRIIGSEKCRLQKDFYNLALAELDIAQIQFQAGAMTELELVEMELELKALELNLKATQLELQTTDFQLKKKLGIDSVREVAWQGTVDADYAGIPLSGKADSLYRIALHNNPEIKSQQFSIYRRTEELKTARQAFLPTIDAEASISISGETFPLQDPGFSVKLIVSFPGSLFPLESSVSLGTRGQISTSRGFAGESKLFENVSSPLSSTLAKKALIREQSRQNELKNDLAFEIQKTVNQYSHLMDNLSLHREYLALELKKLSIMNQQLETGEIKRIDLLKARARNFDSKIDLLEDILRLLDLERTLEKLLGVEPGMLKHLFLEGNGKD